MEEVPVPKIIQMMQAQAGRPRLLGPRPTWETSVAETYYGVFGFAGRWWWQRLANRLGYRGRTLKALEFWGWQRVRG